MLVDQYEFSIDSDVTKIEFGKIASLFTIKNIKMFYLNKDPSRILTFNNNICLEGDNQFYQRVTHLCSIGAFSYSSSIGLGYGVKIGRYCSIAENVRVMGTEHFTDWISTSPHFYQEGYHDVNLEEVSHKQRGKRRVNIGNDVWIGRDVVLKANINIGDGAIIASNSVVTKDVPPYAIVGGIPAKIIKYRFSQDIVDKLKQLQWWRYHKDDLKGLMANQPYQFVSALEKKVELKIIEEYKPDVITKKEILEFSMK